MTNTYQKLLRVTEGILDTAAEDYITENLNNTDSIIQYADNALHIFLFTPEANFILNTCRHIIKLKDSGNITNSNDMYHALNKSIESFCQP